MMQILGLTPILLCFVPIWRILTPVSSHPQTRQCQLIQRTALCNSAQLSSVPAGLPDDILELQLNYNTFQTLQDASLSLYPVLTSLSLACNKLEKVASKTFKGSKLQSLNLASNDLYKGYGETSQALKQLHSLRVLDLSENKVDDEMVAVLLENLTSLEYLNLSGNLLRRLDEASFRDLQQLRELDLQRNIMFEIDGAFNSTPKLQRLNLAFNYLPCLTDFHMAQLVVLNVSHNLLEWFISRQDLNDTFQLETLDLSDNNLLFFPFLPSRSRLRDLYLSNNAIGFYDQHNGSLPGLSATVEFYNLKTQAANVTASLWDDSLHGDVASVETLDLRGNQVERFPEGFIQKMPNLCRLRLCTNCMETLNLTSERFAGSLYELDVSNNRLSQVAADDRTLAGLGNLAYVNLSWNNLERLPPRLFSSLSSIQSVDVSYNSIDHCPPEEGETASRFNSTCVDWRNIATLRQLYLQGTKLGKVPRSALEGLTLTHLDLSDNPGLVLEESSLSRTLQHLGLGNTGMWDFDFSHFQSLKSLNISGNALTRLPPSILNLDLRVLDVRDNGLSTIPRHQAGVLAAKLQTVFLTGNPFNCCQTEWFRTFETTGTLHVVGRSDIECEDLFRVTHRVERPASFLCLEEAGELLLWYILLALSGCLLAGVVSILVLLTLKPQILQKQIPSNTIKNKYLKHTSY